jgi:hypothetical protein
MPKKLISKKAGGCVATVGQCPDIGFYCNAENLPVDAMLNPLPSPDCSFAVPRKHHPGRCRYLDRLPDGDFGAACHCAEAKIIALDGLYKEIMEMIFSERYKLVAGWMRNKNRRKRGTKC